MRPSSPPPEMSPDQKLDLIIGAQRRVREKLGIDPTRTLEENVAYMKNHPDAEIRRRYGNLDTVSTTLDPFTDKRNLGEQADLVAFALRDFTTEAGRPKIHLLDKALRRAQGFEDWSTSLRPGQAWQADIDTESTRRIAEMEARRNAELDRRADQMVQGLTRNSAEDNAPDGYKFLSREEFMALGSLEKQIEEVKKVEARAAALLKDPKIQAEPYAKARLEGVVSEPASLSDLDKLPQDEKSAQAYWAYYGAQDAIGHGERSLTRGPSAPKVSFGLEEGDSGPGSDLLGKDEPVAGAAESSQQRKPQSKAQRTPEQRMERLARLQEWTNRKLANDPDWAGEQRARAQSFGKRDLAAEFQDGRPSPDLRQEVQAVRGLFKEERAQRQANNRQTQAPNEAGSSESGEPSVGEERGRRSLAERVERLQDRVATALADGTAGGWSPEQKAAAERFAQTDLSTLRGSGRESRQAFAAQARDMRLLLKESRIDPSDPAFNPREISREQVSVPAVVDAVAPRSVSQNTGPVPADYPGWQDRSRVPEAETARYEVQVRSGGPQWNGSPGFGDRTEIPETQTASYDVGVRRSSRPSFSSAAVGSEPVAQETGYERSEAPPVVSRGTYSHQIDSGITWSGGRSLRRDFGPPAGYDPGPPPGWRGPSYGGPSTGLGALLEGASVAAARHGLRERMDDMSWRDRRDLWRDLHAGFGPRPVENVVGNLVGPLVRGLGL